MEIELDTTMLLIGHNVFNPHYIEIIKNARLIYSDKEVARAIRMGLLLHINKYGRELDLSESCSKKFNQALANRISTLEEIMNDLFLENGLDRYLLKLEKDELH